MVERFVEKPNRERPKRFCAETGYYLERRIFLFGARAFLSTS